MKYQPDTTGFGSARSGRDFDYGVGDDIDDAVRRLRSAIVAELNAARCAELDASLDVRLAYERAVQIAERASTRSVM